MKRKRGLPNSASQSLNRLPQEFFARPSLELAQALLGKVLVKKLSTGDVLRGIIVETEAYHMSDPASHGYGGRRGKRNEATFMGPGHSNVYFTYGMYHCINITAGEDGSCCLIRGIQPLEGTAVMRAFREQMRKKPKISEKLNSKPAKALQDWEITNGPGKVCVAYDLKTATSDKINLITSDIMWLEMSQDESFKEGSFEIATATRIGIDSTPEEARNKPWRFFVKNNIHVSTMKPGEALKQGVEAFGYYEQLISEYIDAPDFHYVISLG